MLKYLYITNNPVVADICIRAGIDYIFVDMEYMGKDLRQAGLSMASNHHTTEDVAVMRQVLDNAANTKTKLLARVNPIHKSSQAEIDKTVAAGADAIMLPMWKTLGEVQQFLQYVKGRTEVFLLLETRQAAEILDEVLLLPGIDRIHIGLNDLHLSYGQKFLFEPLANGRVEQLTKKIAAAGIPYGFGGVAKIGEGMLPAERIIMEHYRLGSSCVILSRSFCDAEKIGDLSAIEKLFRENTRKLRAYEVSMSQTTTSEYQENQHTVAKIVSEIVCKIKEKSQ